MYCTLISARPDSAFLVLNTLLLFGPKLSRFTRYNPSSSIPTRSPTAIFISYNKSFVSSKSIKQPSLNELVLNLAQPRLPPRTTVPVLFVPSSIVLRSIPVAAFANIVIPSIALLFPDAFVPIKVVRDSIFNSVFSKLLKFSKIKLFIM